MTEHNFPQNNKKKKIFRWGTAILSLSLITALLAAGSTFSKYISQSPEVKMPSLAAAAFDVDAQELAISDPSDGTDFGIDLSEDQSMVCAFTVSNNSEVNVTCDLAFKLVSSVDLSSIPHFRFFLYVDGEKEKELELNESTGVEFLYSAENVIFPEFDIPDETGNKVCAIVADYSQSTMHFPDNPILSAPADGPAVTITVNQTEGEF